MFNLSIDKLYPHPDNPRKDLGDLTELADSIKANGIFQNLTVVPKDENAGTYTVVIGHRRLVAAKEAGIQTVPCLIAWDMSPQEQLQTMLLENMQRSDLTVYEQAQGFQQLLDFGCSIDDIARKSGFSLVTVRRRLEIAKLDKDKLKDACTRQPSLGDFTRLAEIKNIEKRNKVLEYIGTKDFDFWLNRAIREEKEAEKLPHIKAVLKELEIKQLPKGERYSSKWEQKFSFYLSNFDDKEKKKLQEAQSKEKGGCYYEIDYGSVYIYTKRKKADPVKRTPEEIEAERQVKLKWAQLERLSSDCYQLRKNFVMKLPYTRSNTMAILKGALIAGVYNEVNYNGSDRDLLAQILFNVTDMNATFSGELRDKRHDIKYYTDLADADVPKLVYALFDDSAKETCSTDYKRALPGYKSSSKLILLYQWLQSLGYDIAAEEEQLLNGTHEVFQEERKSNNETGS